MRSLLVFMLVCKARSESIFVPVLLWESSPMSKSEELVSALSFMNISGFSNHLATKIDALKPLIVQFVEPTLSVEDFSLHSEAYTEIKNVTSTAAKIEFIPSVEDPLASVKDLMTSHSYSHTVYSGVNTSVKTATIFEVNLSDTLISDDRSTLLRRHDTAIAQIYRTLIAISPHTLALYTGRTNPWAHQIVQRDAKNPSIVYRIKDMRIETASDPILDIDGNKIVLKGHVDVKSDTEIGYSRLIVNYKIGNQNTILRFRFYFDTKNWNLGLVEMEKDSNVSVQSNVSFLKPLKATKWLPLGTPFTSPGEYVFQNETVKLIFESFRAIKSGNNSQPTRPPARSHARNEITSGDGTVFFTPIIWTGIIVVFILGLILGWGITMLLDIKTMDRFDDPKAKIISINTVD